MRKEEKDEIIREISFWGLLIIGITINCSLNTIQKGSPEYIAGIMAMGTCVIGLAINFATGIIEKRKANKRGRK